MSHRIDIELTSNSGDSWTWRAAGARQPKGALDAGLLYPGAKVGDVVRAEIERELEGTRVLSVVAPRSARSGPEVLELIQREAPAGVSVQYADRPGGRRDRDGDRRGPREPRGDRGEGRGDRGEGSGDRGPRRDRPTRDGASRDAAPRDRAPRDRSPRPERSESRPRPEGRPARPGARDAGRPRRLHATRVHRDALIDTLPVEQRPIAEQLFRGGIPAVRQAIIDQNAQLRASGQAEVPAAALLSMAEDLLPRVRTADWLDHAASALDVADEITIRDLRAVVTQADQAARDDASREMAVKLREALARRVEGERTSWANEITAAMDEGKLVRAVRLSSRIPDPGARLNPEVSARLVAATNEALSPATRPDVWAAMIEAAADAPFRREVAPVGLPEHPGESLLTTAANASNRIPALLKLLGLTIPPPPRAKAGVAHAPAHHGAPPPPPPLLPAARPAPQVAAAAPAAVEPVAAEPVAAEPVAAEPVAAEQVAAEPVVAEPLAVEQVAAEQVVEQVPVVEADSGVDALVMPADSDASA